MDLETFSMYPESLADGECVQSSPIYNSSCTTLLYHTVVHIQCTTLLFSKCTTLLANVPHFLFNVPHFYIVKQLTFSGSLSHYFLSGSFLYVLCSTPFPLPYLLSLKQYFVDVYISFLNIWWFENDLDFN